MAETRALKEGSAALASRIAALVEVLRGGQHESTHFGHVAVVDTHGKLLAWAGDPSAVVFPRSAFKPFQALPLVESGVFARSGLGSDALALIAGSHGGTDRQCSVVLSILKQAEADISDLRCGAHEPYDEPTARSLRERHEASTAIRNNCSGKHAGMLLLSRALNAPIATYTDPGHPVQRRIFERFGELVEDYPDDAALAVDGCSAPTPRMKLTTLARSFALLAAGVDSRGKPVPALAEIRDAMRAHPENVAGEGRPDTVIMRRLKDVVSKGGAEGIHTLGHIGRGIGIAIKIEDGARRAVKPAVVAVLEELSLVTPADVDAIQQPEEALLRNHAGIPAGAIRATLKLQRAAR